MNLFKIKNDLESITDNAIKHGKSKEQIKQLIKVYLEESKKKINPDNLL